MAKGEVGHKADDGKPFPRLLPIGPLMVIVDVLTFGAHKYGPNNWQHVDRATERPSVTPMRYCDTCSREWVENGVTPRAASTTHLGHAGCCLLFLLWFELRGDDG